MSSFRKLIHEIHRRSLWQVLGIYLAGSWVALEVVDGLTEAAGLPEWFPSFALALLVVGFPFVMATAFVQEGMGREAGDAGVPPPESRARAPRSPIGGRPRAVRRLLTWRNALLGGVAAFALWGVVATGWMLMGDRGGETDEGPEASPSIAVLPFVNMSADPENEYFSDGVTEEIITALSRLPGLKVVSRSATFRYKDAEVDPRGVGQELGVGTILEGSVRREADRVRIHAQLISVDDGFHLWSETYDRRYASIFEIQEQVAASIAQALQLSLTESERERLRERPTDDLEAYEFYSQGRHEFYRYTEDGNAEAIRLFQRALELDPDYALALAGLSLSQSQYVNRGWSNDERWLDEAERNARRAIELDPDLAEAHFALGFAFERRGMFGEQEGAIRTALALNPNHAHAHDSMADVLSKRGLLERALEEFDIALRLDPFLVPALFNSGRALLFLGRYDEALSRFRRGLESDPDVESFHLGIGDVRSAQGAHAEAARSYRAALALAPTRVDAIMRLAGSLLALGELDATEEMAERLLALRDDDARAEAGSEYVRGRLAWARGDVERAIEHFRRASAVHPGRVLGAGGLMYRPWEPDLGRALIEAGRAGEAVGVLRRALEDAPYLKPLHYELGRALEAAGDPAAARSQYRAFLDAWRDADPGAALVADVRGRLGARGEG